VTSPKFQGSIGIDTINAVLEMKALAVILPLTMFITAVAERGNQNEQGERSAEC